MENLDPHTLELILYLGLGIALFFSGIAVYLAFVLHSKKLFLIGVLLSFVYYFGITTTLQYSNTTATDKIINGAGSSDVIVASGAGLFGQITIAEEVMGIITDLLALYFNGSTPIATIMFFSGVIVGALGYWRSNWNETHLVTTSIAGIVIGLIQTVSLFVLILMPQYSSELVIYRDAYIFIAVRSFFAILCGAIIGYLFKSWGWFLFTSGVLCYALFIFPIEVTFSGTWLSTGVYVCNWLNIQGSVLCVIGLIWGIPKEVH